MAARQFPQRSQWYRHLDKGQGFMVVEVDRRRRLVELQHFDGDLEEIDLKTWFSWQVEPAAEPEDWTGPYDDVETDDLGYTETAMQSDDWSTALEELSEGRESWEIEGAGDAASARRPREEPLSDEHLVSTETPETWLSRSRR